MIKVIKLWIGEYVIYRSKTEQKTTLSSMNKLGGNPLTEMVMEYE